MAERPLLIVNADDFGLTEGVSRAIIDAHRDGVVTSTSLLAVGPAFARTARMLDDVPELGLGAHLAAVGEDPPLLAATEIPSLVDASGRFPMSWRTFLARCGAGRIDPDDLRREFGAQLEAILDRVGRGRLDHLDSHQNVHLWPTVRTVLFELGDRHAIRAVRVTRSRRFGIAPLVVRTLGARLALRATRRGWGHPEVTAGLDEAGTLATPQMVATLATVGDAFARGARSAELATHPGRTDDPELDRYAWGYRWGEESAALRSPEVRAAVDRLGARLGTFADLPGEPVGEPTTEPDTELAAGPDAPPTAEPDHGAP